MLRVMRRWICIAAATFVICGEMLAQEYAFSDQVLEFIGNSSEEDIDPDEAQRLQRYIERPLRINMADAARIIESGLLTQYQTVSLLDYRSRHGDILSFTELATVDGFGQEFVRKLSSFVSLESGNLPGQALGGEKKIWQEIDIKGGVRSSDVVRGQYSLKYRLEAGERLEASLSVSKSSEASVPDAFTTSLFWHFRRNSSKLAIGNFNARFGQGLALWNGMNLSGLVKPSSYLKRSSCLSPSHSFTGNYAFRGIAVETSKGHLRISALTALNGLETDFGLLPAVNISCLLPYGQAGFTHYVQLDFAAEKIFVPDMKTACDFAFTIDGTDIFSEIAYDWRGCTVACLGGVVFLIGENLKTAAMLRYYPSGFRPTFSAAAHSLTKCSNEYGTSVSCEFSAGKWMKINGSDGAGSSIKRIQGSFCSDAAYFPVSKSADGSESLQLKCQADLKVFLSESIAVNLRISERFRTWGRPFRTDLRMDFFYYSGYLDFSLRANALKCDRISFLSYAEAIFKAKKILLSFRSGYFDIDSWDDRIYAYERDIPGSFNVPAFYGNGYWLSATGSWKFARWGRVYLRASLTEYPFGEKKKPGKAELKLMLRLHL